VIISYIYPTARASGGQISSYVGGNSTVWAHVFTSTNTFIA
jgi:hypothetical protein